LSLPFNNDKDKLSQTIEDLRQATEEVLNNNQLSHKEQSKQKIEGPPPEPNVDEEIDDLYDMGPTIQEDNALEFALEFAKNHTIEFRIEAIGPEEILRLLAPENKSLTVEKTEERASKVEAVELFQMGRMNFKKEYKELVKVFPDIGKVSRHGHFNIIWKRSVVHAEGASKMAENVSTANLSQAKS